LAEAPFFDIVLHYCCFGLQDVGIPQIFYSQAVIQRTIVYSLSRNFGDQFGEKDCGLCPYNLSAKEVGGLEVFFVKLIRTLNSFQIFNIKI
jgi:hypothetical protein